MGVCGFEAEGCGAEAFFPERAMKSQAVWGLRPRRETGFFSGSQTAKAGNTIGAAKSFWPGPWKIAIPPGGKGTGRGWGGPLDEAWEPCEGPGNYASPPEETAWWLPSFLQLSVPVSQLSPVKAGGTQKVIILLGAILGFHEWCVENPVSTSGSVFTFLPNCTVCMPEWSQKPGDSPGRGRRALGTSDTKDPTRD